MFFNTIQREVETDYDGSAQLETRAVDEAVFMSTFLPRSLSEISNIESDAKKLGAGEREDAYASAVAGMLNVMKPNKEERRANPRPVTLGQGGFAPRAAGDQGSGDDTGDDDVEEEEEEEDGDDDDGSDDDAGEGHGEGGAATEGAEERTPGEDGRDWSWDGDSAGRLPPSGSDARAAAKVAKKAAAQKAKEDAREKRKTKLPKHIKKKATKSKGQGNKKK